MDYPKIIQGGMAVGISTWKLARAVSQLGQLGVVSLTGINQLQIGRLMDGDPEEHYRRAFSHFPFQDTVEQVLERHFIPGGKSKSTPYKYFEMWSDRPSKELKRLTVLASFAEIYLAKEGHSGLVGINLMEKVQFPHLPTIYGAMLAGMDCMIMGAGIPFQIPGILDRLAQHQPVSYRLDVENAAPDDEYYTYFDPQELFPGVAEIVGPLKRPQFFPIVSSVVLAKALLKRATGKIDGFVVEGYIAGGHNAPPRGPLNLNEMGEPIYTEKDVVDLHQIAAFELPFWVAGGYGNPEGLQRALAVGAKGIQAGTVFAYSDESGMESTIKQKVIHKVLEDKIRVRTDPLASPTNYPFKVVELDGTIYDPEIYNKRQRICDIGMLRTLYKTKDDKLVLRCPSEPVDAYVKKGGSVEDTVGRQCLCNALTTTGGQQQVRPDGYVEPPVVTSGDEIKSIKRILKPGQDHYSAADAVDFLLNGQETEKVSENSNESSQSNLPG